ncbi:hypothetical protein H5410_007119 [Solanum commersonii]|uniref:Uncharacterized protein n=1 Tax=Solanum commersonii TaxID=4109 RepID=A0A9J6AB73_SOLCO|nr:hypothetical protein H5410_007119 [Solanum commersonii]
MYREIVQFNSQRENEQVFAVEEGSHQVVIIKFSFDTLEVKDFRTFLPKHLGIKENYLVGLLARRHILLRIDQYEDYVVSLLKSKLQWPVSGSLPRLSPDLFTKRSLLSMASVFGRSIAIDKATQDKTRPRTSRVKVILNLTDKLPKRMLLQHLDEHTGKIQEHQGRDENNCRLILKMNQDHNHKDNGVVGNEQFNGKRFQGDRDLRQILNEKRGLTNISQSTDDNTQVTDANNNEIAMVEAIINNGDRVVDTCVQDDTLNTTITPNCTLTTPWPPKTLVLGAKDGVTRYLVVPAD